MAARWPPFVDVAGAGPFLAPPVLQASYTTSVDTTSWDYGHFDDVRPVKSNGSIHFQRRDACVTSALGGHEVGLLELDDDVWLVHFCGHDLGLFETGETAISPLEPHHREAAAAIRSGQSGQLIREGQV